MDTLTKILSLISVAIILYHYYNKWVKYNKELQKKTWPLRYPDCPDYWELTENGSCRNKFALGSDCADLATNQTGACVPNSNKSNEEERGTEEECRNLTQSQCGRIKFSNKPPDACEFDPTKPVTQIVKNFNENITTSLENKTDKARLIALKRRGVWARDCNVTWEGIDKLPAPDANDGLK